MAALQPSKVNTSEAKKAGVTRICHGLTPLTEAAVGAEIPSILFKRFKACFSFTSGSNTEDQDTYSGVGEVS